MSGYDEYLDRILDADASRSSVYPERGTYLVRLEDLLFNKNRKGETNSIWELGVLRSNNADIPPGTSMGWLQKMSRDSSPGNIQMNLAGVLGIAASALTSDKEKGKKAIRRAYSDEKDGKSPLSGVLAKMTVSRRTSGEGNSYLFSVFERFGEQDEGSIPSQEAWKREFGVATTATRDGGKPIEGSKPAASGDTGANLDDIPF